MAVLHNVSHDLLRPIQHIRQRMRSLGYARESVALGDQLLRDCFLPQLSHHGRTADILSAPKKVHSSMGISQGRFRAQRAIREELRRVRCAVAQHRS